MEPKNYPIEKENHLPDHHFQVRAVNLPGCKEFLVQRSFAATKNSGEGVVFRAFLSQVGLGSVLKKCARRKNPPILSMESWLVNRDSYNGLS